MAGTSNLNAFLQTGSEQPPMTLPSRLITLAFALVVAGVTLALHLQPAFNWDMLGYLGVIERLKSADDAAVHEEVYGPLRARVDAATFERLTESIDYRRQVYADPRAFVQQTVFYAIRPLYWGLSWGLASLGLDKFTATYLLSNLCYALIALACFGYLYRRSSPLYAALGAVLVMLYPALLSTGRASTPDIMLALCVLAFFLLFVRERVLAACSVLLVAVFVRTDIAVFNAILAALLLFRPLPSGRKLAALGLLTLSLAAAFAIQKLTGFYGWPTIFHFALIEMTPYPADAAITISLETYLATLGAGVRELIGRKWLWLIALLAVVYLALCRIRPWRVFAVPRLPEALRRAEAQDVVLLASLAYLVLRTLIFPASWPRFYLGQITAFHLCLLVAFYARYGAMLERRLLEFVSPRRPA